MTIWADEMSRAGRLSEGALWLAAAFVTLSLHAGALAWMLQEPPVVVADSAPSPAIMIELADAPTAVMTEKTEISPDRENSDAIRPVENVKAPEEVAEPETEPAEQVAEVKPVEEIEHQTVVELDKVEVPIPVAAPKPPEVKKEETKKQEKKKSAKQPQRQQAATQAAVQAQAQINQSNRNAASQAVSSSGAASMSPANWQSRLMAHLERRKTYPSGARSRGETGIVYVRFSIDDSGRVLSASLVKSSGFPELDREGLSLVHRASPVPPPPPGANKTITAPVRFRSG